MNKKLVILAIVIAVIIIGLFLIMSMMNSSPSGTPISTPSSATTIPSSTTSSSTSSSSSNTSSSPTYPSILTEGQSLFSNKPGQNKLVSPDGQYALVLEPNGALSTVNLSTGAVLNSTSVASNSNVAPYYAAMQYDGNFCVYDANGVMAFCTFTQNGKTNHSVEISNNGTWSVDNAYGDIIKWGTP